MEIYLFIFALPVLLSLLLRGVKKVSLRNNLVVWIFFTFLYFFMILRDFSVGRDILGYRDVYMSAGDYPWFYSRWTYMESGYVFLMKLGNVLGMSFRTFMAFLYLIILVPIAMFISRTSKDVVLSIIIYICFQFFVSDMSALRQMTSLGLCVLAFLRARNNGILPFLEFCVIVVAATLIHKGAIVFLLAYFMMRIPLNWKMAVVYSLALVVAYYYRGTILRFLQDAELTHYEMSETLSVGSSFIFMVAVAGIAFFTMRKSKAVNTGLHLKRSILAPRGKIELGVLNYANLLLCGVILLYTFSGTPLMRAGITYQIALVTILPNMTEYLHPSLRKPVRIAIALLMLFVFYNTVLLPNQFDIVPYSLGHDVSTAWVDVM